MATLRPAADLQQERESQTARHRAKQEQTSLDRVAGEIEKAHQEGKSEVWVLTVPQSVVQKLQAAGYRVSLMPAAHCGDVESHRIYWG